MSIDTRESSREEAFHALLGSAREAGGTTEIPDATFADLDWSYVTARIAERCRTADGRELALAMGVLARPEALGRRWAEGREAMRLIENRDEAPMASVESIGPHLAAARRGMVLDGLHLLAVARSCEAALQAREWWKERGRRAPLLGEHAAEIVDLAPIRRTILPVIAPSGELLDEASAELGPLRTRVRRLRESIQTRLDRILKSPRYEGILQDDYVTLRDERYVLPIRAGEKGDFPGIVHGQSGSGATLFIEPAELIEVNNEFRVAQMAVESEELRIRRVFTDLIAGSADTIEANQDVLTYLDLSWAIARFGDALGATLPTLVEAREDAHMEWRDARHPILAIRRMLDPDGEDIVPNTIRLGTGARFLIISGPNAGGKTVTLKTIGLIALMTRAGLPIPVHADSRVPVFERVFTVIGDHQTVERDLSTFSGHVASIADFMHRCDPQSLVLLDELFAGTDPEQGAALGRALLESLARRGCWGIVTTHLESLKTLAFRDERFTCASVGFDLERLAPTYQLRHGVPGASYAFRIAGRLGLPQEVVQRATELMAGSEHAAGEEVIDRMERELASLRMERDEAVEIRRRLEAREDALTRREERLAEERQRLSQKGAAAIGGELDALRTTIREVARRVESAATPGTEEERAEARRMIEEARAAARAAEAEAKALRSESKSRDTAEPGLSHAMLEPGMRVWVRSFGREGRVVEVPAPGARIPVQLGPIRTSLDLAQLGPARAGQGAKEEAKVPTHTAVRAQRPPEELDLRGMRVEDAIERVEAEVERWGIEADRPLRIIHGHGTGALRQAVRELLARGPFGKAWRKGERQEGGDGVTLLLPPDYDRRDDA